MGGDPQKFLQYRSIDYTAFVEFAFGKLNSLRELKAPVGALKS